MSALERRAARMEQASSPAVGDGEIGVQLLLSIQGPEEQREAAEGWLDAHADQLGRSPLCRYLASVRRVAPGAVS